MLCIDYPPRQISCLSRCSAPSTWWRTEVWRAHAHNLVTYLVWDWSQTLYIISKKNTFLLKGVHRTLVRGALIRKYKVTYVHDIHIRHTSILPAHPFLGMSGDRCQRLKIFHSPPVNVPYSVQRCLLFCGWVWGRLNFGLITLSLGGIFHPRPGGTYATS